MAEETTSPIEPDLSRPMTIIGLEIDDFKAIRAMRLQPNGAPIVTLGGENGAGKTSVLDAIEVGLRGRDSLPQMPVRNGAAEARTFIDLGEITVEREIDARGPHLVVKGKDGRVFKSPQSVLDKLISKVCFDPFEFYVMDATKQDATLRKLAGIDLTELESEESKAYAERTDVNKLAKSTQAQFDAAVHHAEAPEKEVSVAELNAELDRARANVDANRKKREAVADLAQEIDELGQEIVAADGEIAELQHKIQTLQEQQNEHRKTIVTLAKERDAEQAEVSELTDPDLKAIRERIATAEETNRKVRENQKRAELQEKLAKEQAQAKRLSDRLDEIAKEKERRLKASKFPVPGLGFSSIGPTLDGPNGPVPLAQASEGQKLRLSVAIGFQLNPTVRVLLIRRGSLIDDKHLAMIAEIAAANQGQVWIEKVTKHREDVDVFIVDGEQQ